MDSYTLERIKIIVNTARTIDTVKEAFKIYNLNHLGPKKTSHNCGRCVNRVFETLKLYA